MLRIAICDDDSKFTRKLETLVLQESQKLGIRADTDVFSDGKTLLKSFQNGDHYELIFIDIEMEQVDGITAARRIREIDRTVLLVYVSGYDKYLKELFEVEPFRFLSKPLNHDFYFSCHISRPTVDISKFSTFFSFPRHISRPKVCISHFP